MIFCLMKKMTMLPPLSFLKYIDIIKHKLAKANCMRKVSTSSSSFIGKISLLFFVGMLFLVSTKAQNILAEWQLSKNKPLPVLGVWGPITTATGVNAPIVIPNDSFNVIFGTPTPGTYGLKLKQSHNWPGGPTPLDLHYAIDFPISPSTGNDLLITGLSMEDSLPTSSGGATPPTLSVIPYYQIDGKGNWTQLAPAQSFPMTASKNVNFGTISVPFFYKSSKSAAHTYTIRLYFYSTNGALKGDVCNLTNVTVYGTVQTPARITPSINTISAGVNPANGKYSGIVTGSYDFGSTFQKPANVGVAWSTSANPDIVSSFFTTDGASGIINSNITGLSANTLYHVRAYLVTPIDTLYGQDLTFTTDNFTAPVDSTVAATNVLSVKATVGGIITDSGGAPITNKMIKYGTNRNALSNVIKPTTNTGSSPYSVTLTQLQPSTKYYYQACATNIINTSCGNIDSFTTSVVVPTLTASPNVINFGDIIYNSTAPVISYTLVGNNLNPATGIITININPVKGFIISSSSTTFPTTPVSSISIPYSGGKLKKAIYVKLLTSGYGSFTSTISHNCLGVAAQDADSLTLSGNIIPSPDKLSNMGTDFWTGFGCEENMKTNTTQFDTIAGVAKGAHFSLYIATGGQTANVLVDMPGIPKSLTFPRTVTIPANSVTEVGGFPVGDGTYNNPTHAPDSRLYFTGVSSRGIHVTSTNGVPIACWLYDWATNNSAAGAMMFPSNTWNSSYSVQAYGGTTSNTGVVSSYFFAIANDDNTVLTITPTADIIDSASSYIANKTTGGGTILHPKGTTYYVTLPHKGDVYNAIGMVDANSGIGYDLTGTKISTDCNKKIAVFGGNSRTLINTNACNSNTSGSDNLIQQMFPKVAWGTKYLTVPTKNMEFNTFRVSVEDASTVVKVNGFPILAAKSPVLGSTWNAAAAFYEFASNQPMSITSDKPISVTQFIMPGKSCGGATVGNDGTGDPEMILLSPIQQAINNSTVFCPGFKDGTPGGTYINVIIPSSGVNSFTIDGKTVTSTVDTGSSSYGTPYGVSSTTLSKAFVIHKGDTSYRYAMFHVSYPAAHTISSAVPFNAIAYGESQGESWGFNAGTTINNLSSVKIAENPNGNDTSSSVILTCKDNPVRLQIALPYLPSQVDSIVWSVPNNSNINLSGSSTTGPYTVDPNDASKVIADTIGSIVQGGQTFYLYRCPVVYQFSDYGFYPIVATAYGTFQSDCAGTDAQNIYVQVGSDNIDFKVVKAGCTSTNVTITDNSTAMAGASIVKWIWDLGDKSPIQTYTDSVNHNPSPNPYSYPSLSAYTIKLTTVNNLGCNSTDVFPINLAFGINAGFTKDNDTICGNTAVTFTDTSSVTADKWVWDFGEPSSPNNTATYSSSINPTHTYTTNGKHIITLQVFSGVCPSNVFKDSVYVTPNPVANFTFGGVCLPGSTVFTNTSDTATGFVPYAYSWNFGDSTNGIPNTTNTINGTHTYQAASTNPNGYAVSLIATNRFGCIDTVIQNVNKVYGKPTADFTVVKSDVCLGNSANFSDNSNSTVDNTQIITKWHWAFGVGNTTTTTINTSSHLYNSIGTDSVKLVVETNKGCLSDSSIGHAVIVHPLPIPSFVLPGSCLGSGSVTFTNTSTISSGELMTYSWSFGDPNNPPNTSTTTDGVHNFKDTGTYSIVLTPLTAFGCSADTTELFNIAGTQPIPSFTVANSNGLCSNVPVSITDVSRIGLGVIKRVDFYWNYTTGATTPDTTDNSPSKGLAGNNKSYTHSYPLSVSDQTYNIRLVAYSGSNCLHDTIIPITVHGIPKSSFVLPSSCVGNGAVTFTNTSTTNSGGALNSSWAFGDASNPPNTSATTDGVHNFKDTGTYSIVLTSTTTFGCSVSDTASFNVAGSQPIPSFTVANTNSLCSNLPITITDNSRIAVGVIKKVELYWNYIAGNLTPDNTDNTPSNGLNGSNKVYSHSYPLLSTDKTYNIRLVAYSGSTCDHDTIISVTVHGSPKVSFANQPDICASAAPIAFVQASETTGNFNGNGGFTYTGLGVNNSNQTFDPSKVGGGNSGTIKAIYTSTAGCKDSANSTIKVLASVDLSFSPNKIKMCKTDSIQLTPISKTGVNYSWSESDGKITLSDLAIKSPKIGPISDSTVYTVLATNPTYCSSSASITVFASPYPKVKITSPAIKETTICFGATAQLKAQTTSPNIVWSPDSLLTSNTLANVIANPYDTLTYIVKVTDNSYCTKSASDTVTVNVLPKFSVAVRVGKDTSTDIVPNEPVQLYAYIVDTAFHSPVKYNWKANPSTTNYLSGTIDIADPILTLTNPLPSDSIIYTVTATTIPQGCEADTNFVVKLFHKPALLVATAFLPNSSIAENRVLIVNPIGITHFQYFKVYNRNGQQVFSTTEIGKGWDGTFNGQPADTGTYVWIAAGTDFNGTPHSNTGTVVLIR